VKVEQIRNSTNENSAYTHRQRPESIASEGTGKLAGPGQSLQDKPFPAAPATESAGFQSRGTISRSISADTTLGGSSGGSERKPFIGGNPGLNSVRLSAQCSIPKSEPYQGKPAGPNASISASEARAQAIAQAHAAAQASTSYLSTTTTAAITSTSRHNLPQRLDSPKLPEGGVEQIAAKVKNATAIKAAVDFLKLNEEEKEIGLALNRHEGFGSAAKVKRSHGDDDNRSRSVIPWTSVWIGEIRGTPKAEVLLVFHRLNLYMGIRLIGQRREAH